MRSAAIILTGLSIGMLLTGDWQQFPFLIAIAIACEWRYRSTHRPADGPPATTPLEATHDDRAPHSHRARGASRLRR